MKTFLWLMEIFLWLVKTFLKAMFGGKIVYPKSVKNHLRKYTSYRKTKKRIQCFLLPNNKNVFLHLRTFKKGRVNQ